MKEDQCKIRALQQLQQRECDNKMVMNINCLVLIGRSAQNLLIVFVHSFVFLFVPQFWFLLWFSLSHTQQTDDTFAEIFVLPLLTLATSSVDHNKYLSLSHTNTHNPKTPTLILS